jgi:hypothetical protein
MNRPRVRINRQTVEYINLLKLNKSRDSICPAIENEVWQKNWNWEQKWEEFIEKCYIVYLINDETTKSNIFSFNFVFISYH